MRKYDNIALLFAYGGVSFKYILNTVTKFSDIIFLYLKTLLVQTIYYFLITNV